MKSAIGNESRVELAGFGGSTRCEFDEEGGLLGRSNTLTFGSDTGPVSYSVKNGSAVCPLAFKCDSCPERLKNGGKGSLSERIGVTATGFLNIGRAAKAWVVSRVITFGMPK